MYRLTRHSDYLFTFLFFIAGVLLFWYLLFEKNLAGSSEKLLAAVLSSVSFMFGVTQFLITQINIKKKKFFDLRYGVYKEIVAKVESISQMVTEVMVDEEQNEPHGLISKLMIKGNEFVLLNKLNEGYLFPGLTSKKSSIKINEIINDLLSRTDEFRHSVEAVVEDGKKYKNDGVYIIERMNWHNDVRELLRSLHKNSYDYYSDLQVYL